MSPPLLHITDITKNFDGVKAIENLSFSVQLGLITAIIGPNGAGKTTLFNLITGFSHPDSGNICFQNKNITKLNPDRIARLGISRTFQNIRLFSQLTALENILLALASPQSENLWSALIQPQAMKHQEANNRQKALELLELVGLHDKQEQWAENLSYGQRRLLEIARAVATKPTLLVLDEPMSGLSPKRVSQTKALLKTLQSSGQTILFIEHNVKAVMDISDQIIVLNHGKTIAEGNPAEIQQNQIVIAAYLGGRRDATRGC
jgi:ABC-type branched-subunit amino acid transport system ATPase component